MRQRSSTPFAANPRYAHAKPREIPDVFASLGQWKRSARASQFDHASVARRGTGKGLDDASRRNAPKASNAAAAGGASVAARAAWRCVVEGLLLRLGAVGVLVVCALWLCACGAPPSPNPQGAPAGAHATEQVDTRVSMPAPNSRTDAAGARAPAAEGGMSAPPSAANLAGTTAVAGAGGAGAAASAMSGGRTTADAAGAAATGMQPPAAGSGAAEGGRPSYLIGADVTDQEPAPAAVRAKLLASMRAHGFNAIRLRTFVDPKAADGYDKEHGYADLEHTIDFAKQIKAAGMSLTVDFHYSDNWADPGKQCVPIAWQKYQSIAELASALADYTHSAILQLIAADARPDMVQIGNEITPGMLLHRCDARGLPTGDHTIQGSTKHWPDLGALLKAGADAVRQVDPTILIALHIDRGGDKTSDRPGSALALSSDWLTNAQKYVQIDAFGESCYQRYQGDPNSAARSKQSWQQTLAGIAQRFPNVKLFAAEYGPAQREINDVVFDLAKEQGLGTFNWQPTTQGDWNTGHDLWRRNGDEYTEQPDLALYNQMQLDYATRL